MLRTFKLAVEYDGTDFAGWQSQGQGERTVQTVLTQTISRVMDEAVTLYAAGRTDTGVHARGQVVSFQSGGRVPVERLAIALNANLPRDLAVASALHAPDAFHARFSARARTYGYLLWTRRTRSALWGRFSLHCRRPIDLALMHRASQSLIGVHDFAGFAKSGGDPGPTTVRQVQSLRLRRLNQHAVLMTVTANGFLRSMVRNIMGTLLEVGYGDLMPDAVAEILRTARREANPCPPAAPQGLCLLRVDY